MILVQSLTLQLFCPCFSPGPSPVSHICFVFFTPFVYCSSFRLLNSLCFFLVYPTVFEDIPFLLTKAEKSGQKLLRPRPREPPISHEKLFSLLCFFFFRSLLSLSHQIFFLYISSGILYLNPFLSLSVLTCSSSVRKCPLRSYLYSDVGHRNTFINLLLAIMHTKGC